MSRKRLKNTFFQQKKSAKTFFSGKTKHISFRTISGGILPKEKILVSKFGAGEPISRTSRSQCVICNPKKQFLVFFTTFFHFYRLLLMKGLLNVILCKNLSSVAQIVSEIWLFKIRGKYSSQKSQFFPG